MSKTRILLSAYACEPGKGSEPGIGWNIARELARHHQVWVITRANNRQVIETHLNSNPVSNLHFAYYDLPAWARWWKKGSRGIHLYYYLWQIATYFVARRLHNRLSFDLVQHATFGRYWSPSLLCLLPVPFVWGPVGGGESAPKSFWRDFSNEGRRHEALREMVRWLGEHDPLVRMAAKRCALALAATEETAQRLRKIGARRVRNFSNVGLPDSDFEVLCRDGLHHDQPVRFISMGNLFAMKGFSLGLRAFARARLENAEYWIVGAGPEHASLQTLAHELGVAAKVKLWGSLSRTEALHRLQECHVLVHPSLHDSGGWVCVEAMAARRPVICLDLGGPALQIADGSGVKTAAISPEQAVSDIAEAMKQLASDTSLRTQMGESARQHAWMEFRWRAKGQQMTQFYREVMA